MATDATKNYPYLGELVTYQADSKTVREFVNGKEKIKKVRVKKGKATPQKKKEQKRRKKQG